jgi:hypothetical protein
VAIGFIHTMRPQDRATVIGFARRIKVLQALTSDTGRLREAVQRNDLCSN